MSAWGFRNLSIDVEAFKLWRDGDLAGVIQTMRSYDSFEDWPWPMIYSTIDDAYPGSKFILTRRKDPDTWFESLCRHADRTGPTVFRQVIYGYDMPHAHKAEHIRFYENHIVAVRKYFRNRPEDFLEVCWEEGDSWDVLADFLRLPGPHVPFPHMNKSIS